MLLMHTINHDQEQTSGIPGQQPLVDSSIGDGMSFTRTVWPASPRLSQDRYKIRQLIDCLKCIHSMVSTMIVIA